MSDTARMPLPLSIGSTPTTIVSKTADGQTLVIAVVEAPAETRPYGQRCADARYIVRACNAHDKLVDAAQAALAIFKRQNWLATSNDPEALALRQLCDALVAAGAAGAV